jgi:hypothetical protein
MFNSYVKSIMGGHGYNPMFEADKGGSGGSGDGGTNGNEGGNGDEGGGSGNDDPTKNSTAFDDQLKNDPAFKEWYTKKFGTDFSQRTKKLRNDKGELIDADEYWKLKNAEETKKREEETETDKLIRERDEALSRVSNVERSEKRIAVKEFAIEKGYNPKLVARLMESELDKLQAKDGSFEGIESAIEALATEFPQITAQANGAADDDSTSKGGTYSAGDSRRQNNTPPDNTYSKGAERAKARHGNKQ